MRVQKIELKNVRFTMSRKLYCPSTNVRLICMHRLVQLFFRFSLLSVFQNDFMKTTFSVILDPIHRFDMYVLRNGDLNRSMRFWQKCCSGSVLKVQIFLASLALSHSQVSTSLCEILRKTMLNPLLDSF